MSEYVGETEQNIASAFSEAEEQGALLIFDEADSFLQDRSNAVRSWGITQVNEMLTQMESYPYPFVCTTNLMDSLDKACLRRFTFKVAYDYMTPEQSNLAFKHFFNFSNIDLSHLNSLAPGDFVVVKQKAEILGALDKKEELINGYNKELETIELGIKNNVIRSPIDGILNLVNNYNVGDFINLDTNICTVVPKDSDIYNVRITIANRDIGKIKLGDDIEYRIDALPYKEYGKFKGKVKFISSNSITYENGKSLYYINGSIENKEIYSYKGVPNELKIGMSANVSIITDRKKIIYYILEKLNIKNN